MSTCKKKKFDRTDICAGDLDKKIVIKSRAMGNPGLDTLEYTEGFTTIGTPFAALKTTGGTGTKGTHRFDGINIADGVTHLFFIRYQSKYDGLEHGNNFVGFKNRNYRVISTVNNDEQDKFIILQCAERGDDTKTASEA